MSPSQVAAGNVKGILIMLVGVAFLITSDALSKHLLERYPIGQVLCLRQIASLLFVVPYVWRYSDLRALRPRNLRLHMVRGLVFLASGILIMWALVLLPLATVTVVTFAGPIFVAALSLPLLGERVVGRLWLAIALGFVGVLVIVRPGAASFEWALLVPVAGALAAAIRDMLARMLARTDSSIGILFWSSCVLIVCTAFSVLLGWKPVDAREALLFLLVGAITFAAHFLLIEAYRHGRAAVVAPFKYSALLWSTLIGYLVWNHLPDAWTWVGALVLVASGVWIARLQRSPG